MHAPAREGMRIAIVGTGNVGATAAYRILISGLAHELILIDKDPDLAEGHARDLSHSVPLEPPTRVWAGGWVDCAVADIVILCAGAGQVKGESRLDLLTRNVAVLQSILERLLEVGFAGVLLVTTNPVDVLSRAALELSGYPAPRVIGTGTVLDSARLRQLLAVDLHLDPRSVHGYILGEHGDSEIAAWSAIRVGGVPLEQLEPVDFDRAAVLQKVRRAAPEIIQRKGATWFAIASCIQRIVTAIVRDENSILPVSVALTGQYGLQRVYLSTPCVVGRAGIQEILEVPLNTEELAGLRHSAEVLERVYAELQLEARSPLR